MKRETWLKMERINIKERCLLSIGKDEHVEVEYLGVFQRSRVIDASPLIGGHNGGVVAGPVAVIKRNGGLEEVELKKLSFVNVERSSGGFLTTALAYGEWLDLIKEMRTKGILEEVIQEFKNIGPSTINEARALLTLSEADLNSYYKLLSARKAIWVDHK